MWMHAARGADFPDYLYDNRSQYEIWRTFGWPYETSARPGVRGVFRLLWPAAEPEDRDASYGRNGP